MRPYFHAPNDPRPHLFLDLSSHSSISVIIVIMIISLVINCDIFFANIVQLNYHLISQDLCMECSNKSGHLTLFMLVLQDTRAIMFLSVRPSLSRQPLSVQIQRWLNALIAIMRSRPLWRTPVVDWPGWPLAFFVYLGEYPEALSAGNWDHNMLGALQR